MAVTFAAPSKISLDEAGLDPYSGVGQHFLDLFFNSKTFFYQKIFSGQHFYLQTGIIKNG